MDQLRRSIQLGLLLARDDDLVAASRANAIDHRVQLARAIGYLRVSVHVRFVAPGAKRNHGLQNLSCQVTPKHQGVRLVARGGVDPLPEAAIRAMDIRTEEEP